MREIVPTISLTQKHQTVGPHLCGEQSSPGLCPGQTADPISLGGCTPQAMPNPLQPIQKTSILRLRPLRLIFFKSALLHLLQHEKNPGFCGLGFFIFCSGSKSKCQRSFWCERSEQLLLLSGFSGQTVTVVCLLIGVKINK